MSGGLVLTKGPSRSPRRRTRRLTAPAAVGFAILLIETVVLAVPSLFGVADPYVQNLTAMLLPPLSEGYLLGTDQLGRDSFARVVFGGRSALGISLLATICTVVVGVSLGLVSVIWGRAWDEITGRMADIQLAIPGILLALMILSFAGNGIWQMVLVLILSSWVLSYRVTRAAGMNVISQPFVEAARLAGARKADIVLAHLIPAVAPVVMVAATLTFSAVLVLQSTLGYLGLGVQPPTPDWGQMVASGQALLSYAWWVSILPGIALVLTVVAVQLIGDWMAEISSIGGIVD